VVEAATFDRKWTVGSMIALAASLLGWLIYSSSKAARELSARGAVRSSRPTPCAFSFRQVVHSSSSWRSPSDCSPGAERLFQRAAGADRALLMGLLLVVGFGAGGPALGRDVRLEGEIRIASRH